MPGPVQSRRIRSPITAGGQRELALEAVTLPEPDPDEIAVRIEAAPINPSGLALVFGPADRGQMLNRTCLTDDVLLVNIVRTPEQAAREIRTTFASHYCAGISLADALSLDHIQVCGRRHTGQKYLINPQLAG